MIFIFQLGGFDILLKKEINKKLCRYRLYLQPKSQKEPIHRQLSMV
jgi:hypothetical protein